MMAKAPPVHIAASIRLILAMFRLYADIEHGFGKAVIDMLKRQYPGQEINIDPGSIGHKLMNVARKQLQYNDADAQDAINDLLTYLSVGSKYETDENGKIKHDKDSGKAILRKTPKPWDFAKDFTDWHDALNALYSNLRNRAMSRSFEKTDRKKRERSIDQAYGVRGEDGGDPSGGEGRIPTPEDGMLGKALDDKAAIKEFADLIDEHIGDLRSSLSDDAQKLFDLIFEDDVGSFGSDIKENMGQASALKQKYPELYEKNAKRWSGFVGDLRKKLLDEIWKYIDNEMSTKDYNRLKEEFFSDTAPERIREKEHAKVKEKSDYQRGIDLRKVIRMRSKEESGNLSDKEKKGLDNLVKKLEKELKADGMGLDEALAAEKSKSGSGDDEGVEQVASSIASRPVFAAWNPSFDEVVLSIRLKR